MSMIISIPTRLDESSAAAFEHTPKHKKIILDLSSVRHIDFYWLKVSFGLYQKTLCAL